MGTYTCERCLQIFNKKYNYEQHLKRKLICKPPNNETLATPTPVPAIAPAPAPTLASVSAPAPASVPSMGVSAPLAVPEIRPKAGRTRSKPVPQPSRLDAPATRPTEVSSAPVEVSAPDVPVRKKRTRPRIEGSGTEEPPVEKKKPEISLDDVNWKDLRDAIRRQEEELERMRENVSPQVHVDIHNYHGELVKVKAVGTDDDFLDILIKEYGDEERVIKFIMSCSQDSVVGDMRLLNRIYFDKRKSVEGYPITQIDRHRGKYSFINERGEIISEPKQLGQRLANNLQNCYLKTNNRSIKFHLAKYADPMKLLSEYDLQVFNQHIQNLSTENHQKKLLHALKFPDENESLSTLPQEMPPMSQEVASLPQEPPLASKTGQKRKSTKPKN